MLQHPALIYLYLAVFLSLPSFNSVSLKKERTWDQREPQTAQEVEQKGGIRKLLKLLWGHDTRQKAALEKFQTIAPLFYLPTHCSQENILAKHKCMLHQWKMLWSLDGSAVVSHLWAAVGSCAPFMWPGAHFSRQCCCPILEHPVYTYTSCRVI